MLRFSTTGFALAVALALPISAGGQEYPVKAVRILTAQAGGGNDFVARLVAPPLSEKLGQPVIIDNRTGLVSAEVVSKSPPDGYTVLLTGSSFWISPFFRDVPYNPVRDYVTVSQATSSPNILVVHPSLPVRTVRELIDLARARPGELNYASSQIGSPPHMSAELFKAMARVNIMLINYKGTGPSLTATIGGHVEVMFAPAGAAAPHLRAGRLRPIGVTSARATPLVPGVPAVADTVPGYEVVSIIGFLMPAGTPAPIVGRLSEEIGRVLQRADIKERFFKSGAETVGGTPEQFGAAMKSEIAKWGKLIREAKLRAE